jgi:hypothetical protein
VPGPEIDGCRRLLPNNSETLDVRLGTSEESHDHLFSLLRVQGPFLASARSCLSSSRRVAYVAAPPPPLFLARAQPHSLISLAPAAREVDRAEEPNLKLLPANLQIHLRAILCSGFESLHSRVRPDPFAYRTVLHPKNLRTPDRTRIARIALAPANPQ